ncbi:Protein required for ethanol metabolism [Kalmusia sp. IMI 367209]|nr:Protein required for ethanol metabolism [Kalmusia sp. IMI 367209]
MLRWYQAKLKSAPLLTQSITTAVRTLPSLLFSPPMPPAGNAPHASPPSNTIPDKKLLAEDDYEAWGESHAY